MTRHQVADCIEAIRLSLFWKKIWVPIVGFVQIAAYVLTAAFGILLKDRLTVINSGHAWGNWHSYLNVSNLPCGIAGVGAFLCAKFKITREQTQDRKVAYQALHQFYEALQLGKDKSADIRCTLWCPTKKRDRNGMPIELEQWTDYIPPERAPDDEAPTKFISYPRAGRRRRIIRQVKGGTQTIGLLGKCAYDCLKNGKPSVAIDQVPLDSDLVDYLVNVWGFDKHYAERMTPSRLSFMCLPIMNAGYTELLGIVFLDSASRSQNVLGKKLASRAEGNLPAIARAISS